MAAAPPPPAGEAAAGTALAAAASHTRSAVEARAIKQRGNGLSEKPDGLPEGFCASFEQALVEVKG